jgi:hypothetical protein
MLQSKIEDMNAFFQARLGVQRNVVLALLDSKGWTDVTGDPYGIAVVIGNPRVIFMPATSDNPTFGLIRARKGSIPPEQLRAFLQDNQIPIEAAVSQFVDLVGFHELGHVFDFELWNRPTRISCQLLVLRLYLGNGSRSGSASSICSDGLRKIRPQHTSLEDFDHNICTWTTLVGTTVCSKLNWSATGASSTR